MSQSADAAGRLKDLRSTVLDALEGHADLTTRLEQLDTIDDGTEVIVPAFIAKQWDEPGETPPDAFVAISAVTSSSTRINIPDEKMFTVQTVLELTKDGLLGKGIAWHDEVLDEMAAVLTRHRPNYSAQGLTGGTPEPLWDDDVRRYRSAQRFGFRRIDTTTN